MKRALVSVSDKTNLVEFVQGLVAANYEIVSTGGTKKVLDAAGINTIGVEEVTGFPEMLDGRVKTLNPYIHGGLLARRDLPEHMQTLKDHKITPIDLACVNLYPFKKTIEQPDVKLADAIENIDIGGPSMVRSAAKNYQAVTVVVDQNDYARVLAEINAYGAPTKELNAHLAAKAFSHTAAYDALISQYLNHQAGITAPSQLTLTYDLKQTMRYGENSHQRAWFYQDALPKAFSLSQAKQLAGKQLSYNNIKDADAALRIVREFDQPTVVAVKHMNPCGIGQAADLKTAWERAYAADPISIFGGVIALNRKVEADVAELMHKLFLEIIIAPAFSDEARAILQKKKNLRLLELDFSQKDADFRRETVAVMGGLLVQDQDTQGVDESKWQTVTEAKFTDAQLTSAKLAWLAVKHTKSNAIVVANATQTLGIGSGQPNRIDSTKIAIKHAGDEIDDTAVLASDAFFPMDDCVKYAAEHGIKAIVQPGGSIRDQDSIDMANKYGIAMMTTGVRHFRH